MERPLLRDVGLRTAYRYYIARGESHRGTATKASPAAARVSTLRYGDQHTAYEIYLNRPTLRYAIEALITSGVSAAEISAEVGCAESVVETYEDVYFDVRDRLGNELYVLDALLAPMYTLGTSGKDYDFLWKALGYYCGSEVLRSFWTISEPTEDLSIKLRALLMARLQKQSLQASFSRAPAAHNTSEIIMDMNSVMAADSKARADNPDASNDSKNIVANELTDLIQSVGISLRPFTEADSDKLQSRDTVYGAKEQRAMQAVLPEEDDYERKQTVNDPSNSK